MNEPRLNILMLDDDEHVLADHRAALRQRGHKVRSHTRLLNAYEELKKSFLGGDAARIDVVVLDLMVPGAALPSALDPYYRHLSRGQNNQGQALGQWLWESAGHNFHPDRPQHIYFSNLVGNYVGALDPQHQEFKTIDRARSEFVWSKPIISPTKFAEKIEKVGAIWGAP